MIADNLLFDLIMAKEKDGCAIFMRRTFLFIVGLAIATFARSLMFCWYTTLKILLV